MKVSIINFLSNRNNLTIFQCILYLMVGYIMGEYLSWGQMGVMFVLLFGIQFITRTKAVADGMVYRQMMIDSKVGANDLIRQMKKEMDKIKNKDLN